ncbi:hypothetical protein WQ57_00840 [Mesobacillus campisalis]|uniref:Glycosyltransferase 2-like domain-containing protein n=1 Tax=Mesobacillus campisalis TaxID=1408103 RepID=A0A0M2T0X4_9BACI|nr:glycosyltransferase family 2 protein [Mesobacillus campisalis]KKK40078.1 hypothetical protein WQ57_00840 [Mesobacillus campisalis]
MKVSVIMAVYNGEDYLCEAVNSILGQTYREFEFLIVNDGSTDRTKELLDQITDTRVSVIHLKKNAGAAAALNRGIKSSTGKWIAIQDADDISVPTRLEEQVRYVEEQPLLVGVGSLVDCIPGVGASDRKRIKAEEDGANRLRKREEIFLKRFYGCSLTHGSMLFSKKVYTLAGGYNPFYKIAYDYDLWLRMMEYGDIEKLDKTLYQWRVNINSLSRSNYVQTCNEVLLASISAIERMLYKHLRRPPIFSIIGPKKGLKHFHSNVLPLLNISIESYLPIKADLNSMVSKHNQGNIDAIIILDSISYHSRRAIEFLNGKGLNMNIHHFLIWNVVN